MEDKVSPPDERPERYTPAQGLLLTVLACVATTVVATPMLGYLDLANIVMLFLLTVLLVAVKLGRNPAILASVLSVLLFDIFFVPPRFSLAVSNIQYLVTFVVMLATALITAHLAAGLRQRAYESRLREQRTQALYQLARQLAGSLSIAQVAEIANAFIGQQLQARSALLLPDETAHGLTVVAQSTGLPTEPHLAQVAMNSGQLVRSDEVSHMGFAPLYLPLHGSTRTRGVLAIGFAEGGAEPSDETLSLLDALASLITVAVERLHYVAVAQASAMEMLTERLRSSLLSALSHDLRTPLTALVGLADSLFLVKPALPANALETA